MTEDELRADIRTVTTLLGQTLVRNVGDDAHGPLRGVIVHFAHAHGR